MSPAKQKNNKKKNGEKNAYNKQCYDNDNKPQQQIIETSPFDASIITTPFL